METFFVTKVSMRLFLGILTDTQANTCSYKLVPGILGYDNNNRLYVV